MNRLKHWAQVVKRDTVALYFAARHPRTPWYAKALAACVVAYALSPLDLIPDFIPVLGYLDDLLLIPIGVWLALMLIPSDVMAECRARAEQMDTRPVSNIGALVIVAIWVAVAVLAGWYLFSTG